jgi:hypothetical protein
MKQYEQHEHSRFGATSFPSFLILKPSDCEDENSKSLGVDEKTMVFLGEISVNGKSLFVSMVFFRSRIYHNISSGRSGLYLNIQPTVGFF